MYSNSGCVSTSLQSQSQSVTLEDISFQVRPGELLAVIGPVGAGKVSED